ncbi:MAG: ABC transporter permease [Clostridiales bacterium]|nr:ABC transporter permease [Clostridiales bacterium]
MTGIITNISSFLYAAILAGVPLLFGTVGEIITQKAGNLNLGVEGMMYMGAIFGFIGGYITPSPVLSILFAFLGGMLGALIYAILTVSFKANQNVTGLTLAIFGAGLANFLGERLIGASPTGAAVVVDSVKLAFRPMKLGGLHEIPYIGKLFFEHGILTYLAIVIALGAGIYLNHSQKGLNLRAVGENPAAADAAGINVTLYKYIHILAGGGICGLGGAYIAMVTCAGNWTYNCVAGQGWIAVALVIFSSWSPYRAILGALFFGGLSVLRLYIPNSLIQIPTAIFAMVPFVVTCIVLVVTSANMKKENQQPKGTGINYFREER